VVPCAPWLRADGRLRSDLNKVQLYL
jgi:hypothetical protein